MARQSQTTSSIMTPLLHWAPLAPVPQIFLQLLSQVSGLGHTVAGRGHWTLDTALYQAVRVLCQGGTITTTKLVSTTTALLLWPGPGGGEKRRKTAMYLGWLVARLQRGRGSARTGQLYTPRYFPPILATQELTTTPNWSTKTNLGFESPPSCAPPPKLKHNFLPIFLFLKTLLAI